jgi:hypothetical protein
MTTELAKRQDMLPDASTWKTMLEMAGTLVESGMLPQTIKTPAAALAIMQKGRELGIPPMYALSNIGIINGKPVVGAEVLQAMIYRDHGDHALLIEESNGERCSIIYRRRNWTAARRLDWTIEEATAAGLTTKGGPWKQYPAAMLRARCLSAVARAAFADSIGGMYTHEELGAEVDVVDGEIVVVEQPAPVMRMVKPAASDVIQPTPPEEERARAMVQDEPTPRQVAEERYKQLSMLAIDQKHPESEKIKSTDGAKLSDKTLAAMIAKLEAWLADQSQTDEAF